MTEILNNNFNELEKFPVCSLQHCLTRLEIQNRFKCQKCSQLFCCEHRIDFKHNCSSIVLNAQLCTQLEKQPINKCGKVNCNCKLTEINKFNCNRCNKLFCSAHRLDFEHNCVRESSKLI